MKQKSWLVIVTLSLPIILLVALLQLIGPASAGPLNSPGEIVAPLAAGTTFTVTKSIDTDGACDIADCSLREAIRAANDLAGADLITFDLSPNATIVLTGTQLPIINDALTIDGSTAVSLTISGDNSSRIFFINAGQAVTLTALTLVDGAVSNDDGGAIFNLGQLTLVDSAIIGGNGRNGGGLFNLNGTVDLIRSTLRLNNATSTGGAIFSRFGSITINESTLISNTAVNYGGGIYLIQNSSLYLEASTLQENESNLFGGGIYGINSSAIISDSRLISNTAVSNGGGFYVRGAGDFSLFNSRLIGNEAGNGGGIYSYIDTLTIRSSTLDSNVASTSGGGIYTIGGAMTIISSTLSNNTAVAGSGGGIMNNSTPLNLNSSTLSGNSAATGGGLFSASSSAVITNTTISTNTAVNAGGFYLQSGSVNIVGSLMADNSNGDCKLGGGFGTATYTLIEDTGANACNLTDGVSDNIIGQDPALAPLADNGGPTLTHALKVGSQALDKIPFGTMGCGTTVKTDQRGISRPQGARCDIGAFEFLVAPDGCSESPMLASNTVELNTAIACYNAKTSGNHTISLVSDITLISPTTPIFNVSGADLLLTGNGRTLNGAGSYRAFTVDAGIATFEAITITNGADNSGECAGFSCGSALMIRGGAAVTLQHTYLISNTTERGGAIYAEENSQVTIQNSVLVSNTADLQGGAVYNNNGVLAIIDSELIENTASSSDGGGIYATDSTVAIRASELSRNTAGVRGGGISVFSTTTTINNSMLRDNMASEGGGIFNWESALKLNTSTLSDNDTSDSGGGLFNLDATATISNSTLSGNSGQFGGGILNANTTITISYTTVNNNTATDDGGGIRNQGGVLVLSASVVAGNSNGDCVNAGTASGSYNLIGNTATNACGLKKVDDNITGQDPLLEPLADNGGPTLTHALSPVSPARDKIPAGVLGCGTSLTTDQRGVFRPQGSSCDMGAFEVAVPCQSPILVAGMADLNAAIACYNAETDGSHTISLVANVTLISPTTPINNSSGAELLLAGNGHTIDGNGSYRAFTVDTGIATVEAITITNGRDTSIDCGVSCAGGLKIGAGAIVTLTHSKLISNTAENGGAIYQGPGWLVIEYTTIVSNSASMGGGILNSGGALTLRNSTISHNTAVDTGGGLNSSSDSLTINNSTISGNEANAGGGLILVNGVATINNSTINNNAASGPGAGGMAIVAAGGFTPTLHLSNTIVANSLSGPDCENSGGSIAANTSNLIMDGSCQPDFSGDPMLSPLADNGGRTWTHALLPGSPAIDMGDNDSCEETDQRDETRPQDGDGNGSAICDIGAVEMPPDQVSPNLTVNVKSDDGDGICGLAHCSLREAINTANDAAGADTINFNLPDNATITLNGNQLPMITGSLTIDGSTAVSMTVSGNNASRVFEIDSNAIVTITGLAITNGNATGDHGGAIFNKGWLSFSDGAIISNTALLGGGLSNISGTTILSNAVVSSNSSGDYGGGIYNDWGKVSINQSNLISNSANISGGSIFLGGPTGVMTVTRSSLAGNASVDGGGFYTGISTTITIDNSTVSGNEATNGGGLLNFGGTATISNTTFSDNSASTGGGISNDNDGDTRLFSTLIANSSGGDCVIGSGTTNSSYSLIEDTGSDACNLTGANGNLLGQDPLLDGLTDNGGPTLTQALQPGSPALDQILPGTMGCGTTYSSDQRGVSRPQGKGCDMGSYELIRAPYDCSQSPLMASYIADLNDAIACYNGKVGGSHTISLTDNILLTEPTIPINNQAGADLLVAGNGYMVDGDDTYRVFTVDAGDITFEDIIIIRGNDPGDDIDCDFEPCAGGLKIGQGAVVTVSHSSLISNTAYWGGGIYIYYGRATISDSTVIDNTADLCCGAGGGAGIYNESGSLTVNASTIVANSAKWGGGIYNDAGITSINGGLISNNTAQSFGGGILNFLGPLTIDAGTISSNTAFSGGGIWNQAEILTINNSTVRDNVASSTAGGIYNQDTTAIINDSLLVGNTSGNNSGGIENRFGSITIRNSILRENNASGSGGGINNLADPARPATATITNSEFISNTAVLGGGAIENSGGALTVTLSTLNGNEALAGGGISNSGGGSLSLSESILSSNIVSGSGGGISLVGGGVVTVTHSNLFSNIAQGNGGAIYNDEGWVSVGESTLSGNKALTDAGGAIFSGGEASLTVSATILDGNWAWGGGGIYNATGWLTISDSTLSNNGADATGGGLDNYQGVVTISASDLVSNTANNGGAIYNESGRLSIIASSIAENEVDRDGGGILNSGVMTITQSTISGNSAATYEFAGGGGILNDESGIMSIASSSISNNASTYLGGGFANHSGTLSLENSTLSANSSLYGGGLSVWGPVTVESSTFFSNSGAYGGAIYNEGGLLNITNSSLSYNSAEFGGGLLNDDLTVNISNSTITDNRAETYGGGIASRGFAGTFTTITNTIVSGNVISGTSNADDLSLHEGNATDSFISGGYNLIGVIGPDITAFPATGDLTGITDPKLGPLAGNGGDTFTHLLLSGSQAIDGGDNSSCLLVDQRGESRPKDGDGDGTASCDIGSVEMPTVQQDEWILFLPVLLK